MKKSIGVVHSIAECQDCAWRAENYKNAQAIGAMHAKRYHHKVSVEIGFSAVYDCRDEGEQPAELPLYLDTKDEYHKCL